MPQRQTQKKKGVKPHRAVASKNQPSQQLRIDTEGKKYVGEHPWDDPNAVYNTNNIEDPFDTTDEEDDDEF